MAKAKYPTKIIRVRKVMRSVIAALRANGVKVNTDVAYEIAPLVLPRSCDSRILCHHKNGIRNQPEWKHQVRFAIWDLRS